MLDVLAFLTIKHFFADFTRLQPPYMWKNKGNIKHPGGYLHAGLHVLASAPVIMFLSTHWYWILLLEFVSHYAMDWSKVNINKKYGWGPNTHPEFWTLLGVDQLVHYLTYILMVGLL